jgi:hypothetical protein
MFSTTLQVKPNININLVTNRVTTDRSVVVWFNDEQIPEIIIVGFINDEVKNEFANFFANGKPHEIYANLISNKKILDQCHLVKIPQYFVVHETLGYVNFMPNHSYYTF